MFRNTDYCLHISNYCDCSLDYSEKDYYTIICCYNVIHEIGHCIFQEYYSPEENTAITQLEEEMFCNDLAAAFWITFGTVNFIDSIVSITKEAKQRIENENPGLFEEFDKVNNAFIPCTDFKSFYYRLAKLESYGLSFCVCKPSSEKRYDHFQNWSRLYSIENNKSISEVLSLLPCDTFGNLNIDFSFLGSPDINSPLRIIENANRIFAKFGLVLPSIEYDTSAEHANYMSFTRNAAV